MLVIRCPAAHVYMRERGRVGRLMRENDIKVIRTQKYKVEEGLEMIRGIISPTTDGQRSHVKHRAQSAGSGFFCNRTKPKVGGRHIVYMDQRGLAVSCSHPRPLFSAGHRLGRQQPYEAGSGNPRVGYGRGSTPAVKGLHSSYGSWVAILFQRVSEAPVEARLQCIDERQR